MFIQRIYSAIVVTCMYASLTVMFQPILLTVIFGSALIKVCPQTTMSCQAPPLLSTGNKIDPIVSSCVWYSRCSNDMAIEVPINAINCSIPIHTSELIPGNCHLWGRNGPHQQMLFIYLLRITANTITLHYFNDSYGSSQQDPSVSRQQLCTVSNDLNIAKLINESCPMIYETPLRLVVLPNKDSVCCSNVNISVNFSTSRMEIHFPNGFIEIPVNYLTCTMEMMATIPLTSNSTNTSSSTSKITFHRTNPTEEKLTVLVTGISAPLLLLVALAVVIVTIIAIIGINQRKSTNHNQEIEQQDRSYATLMGQEQPDAPSNHPTEVVYAVVDKSKTKKGGQTREDEQNVKNPPNSGEKKRQVALEDMYAVVNKQQKKKCKVDTLPTHSNTAKGEYYNIIVKKELAKDDEEAAPQRSPHTIA